MQISFSKNAILTVPGPDLTGDTANWKTYKNDIYNYSIKMIPGGLSRLVIGRKVRPSGCRVFGGRKSPFDDAFVVVQVLRNTYSDIDAWAHA